MNILFLTLANINSLSERGIYTDLLNRLQELGNTIHIVSPNERRNKKKTELIKKKPFQFVKS